MTCNFTLPYVCDFTLPFHPPRRVKSAGPHAHSHHATNTHTHACVCARFITAHPLLRTPCTQRWASPGALFEPHWSSIGILAGSHCWTSTGPLLDHYCNSIEIRLGLHLAFTGALLDLYWASNGSLLDLYWSPPGTLVDRYWNSTGNPLAFLLDIYTSSTGRK